MHLQQTEYRRDWIDLTWFVLLMLGGIAAIVFDLTVGFETLAGLIF